MEEGEDAHQVIVEPDVIQSESGDQNVVENGMVAPDGGWGWVIVGAAFATSIIVDGIIFSFGIFLPEILQDFPEGKSVTSWVGSVLAGTYLLVGPLVSALANRFSCRFVAVLGSIIGATAFIISCFATSVIYLIITYGILGGIGFGLIYLPSIVMVQFYFEKKRAFATGVAVCGSGIGTFIFSPLTQFLIDKYGWRGNLLIQAGIILNCAAISGLFRPLKLQKRKRPSKSACNEQSCSLKGFLSNIGRRPKPLLQRIKEARQAQFQSSTSLDNVPLNNTDELTSETKRTSQVTFQLEPNGLPNGHGRPCDQMDNTQEEGSTSDTNKNYLSPATCNGQVHNEDDHTDTEISSTDFGCENGGSASYQRTRNKDEASTREERIRSNGELVQRKTKNKKIDERTKQSLCFDCFGNNEQKPYRRTQRNDDLLSRPFYRQDIFFSGSLLRISEYECQKSGSLLNIPEEPDGRSKNQCNICSCDQYMKDTFKAMLDLSLLKSPTFVILCVTGFLTFMGFFVPFVYLLDFAISVGTEKEQATFLLSIIGIANTLGRVFSGWISDRPNVKAIHINNGALVLAGITTAIVPFITIYTLQVVYSLIFGLAIACFVSLRSIILVELLGLEKLTNSFGLTFLFQGVASMIGSPLAGWFFDQTGSYNSSFYVAGVLMAVSGLMGIPLPRIAQWEHNRAKNKKKTMDEESSRLHTSAV